MSKMAVPRGKKKPYPYQETQVFTIDKGACTRVYLAHCKFCDHKKQLSSYLQFDLIVNGRQREFLLSVGHCEKCDSPERISVTCCDSNFGDMRAYRGHISWKSRVQAKLDRKVKELETQKRAIDLTIGQIKNEKLEGAW